MPHQRGGGYLNLRITPRLARFNPPQPSFTKEGVFPLFKRERGGRCEQICDNRVSPNKLFLPDFHRQLKYYRFHC